MCRSHAIEATNTTVFVILKGQSDTTPGQARFAGAAQGQIMIR